MARDEAMEDWEQVDAYLSGMLPKEEITAFEQRIQQEAFLAEAVDKARISRLAVRHYGFRSELKAIHAQVMAAKDQGEESMQTQHQPVVLPLQGKKSMPLWKYASRMAASVLILLVCTLGFRLATVSSEDLSQGQLYMQESTRSEGEADQIKQQMDLAYQQGNYQQCTAIYEKNPLVATANQMEADFMAGNAYLAQNLPERAEKCFRKVLASNEKTEQKRFEEDAEYYLALTLLKENKPDEADQLLSRIRQNSMHPYHDKVGWWFYQQVRWLKWKNG
ncbi:MAG: hypothetical protein V4714_09270 [Bacteroidota bacterium]